MNIILISTGLCLIKKYKTASLFFYLFWCFNVGVILFSAIFSMGCLQSLERYPALEPPLVVDKEQAIVVLCSGQSLDGQRIWQSS